MLIREEAVVGDGRWWKEIREEEGNDRENQLTGQNPESGAALGDGGGR